MKIYKNLTLIKNHKLKIENLEKGFSLIEMLIYITIVTVFLVTLVNFSWDIIYSKVKNTSIAEVNDNSHIILEKLGLAIKNASSISTPNAPGATSQTLILNMPGSAQTTFDISSGRLRINEGAGTEFLTSENTNITNLTFTNLSRLGTEGIIRVQLTISHTNPSNRQEFNSSQNIDASFSLRPN